MIHHPSPHDNPTFPKRLRELRKKPICPRNRISRIAVLSYPKSHRPASRHPVILSSCHLVILSSCHLVIPFKPVPRPLRQTQLLAIIVPEFSSARNMPLMYRSVVIAKCLAQRKGGSGGKDTAGNRAGERNEFHQLPRRLPGHHADTQRAGQLGKAPALSGWP